MKASAREATDRVMGVHVHRRPVRNAEATLLAALFVVALVVRLQKIGEPPFDFATIRQYRGLMIARACYYEAAAGIAERQRETAMLDRERLGVLEPPVLEQLACLAYRIGGAERMWVGRVLSCVFWLLGGLLSWRLARDHVAPEAGLPAAGVYLFVPFGIVASRSFQPDSLTRPDELAAQPELKRILDTGYPKLAETERYVLFDLRRPIAPPSPIGSRR